MLQDNQYIELHFFGPEILPVHFFPQSSLISPFPAFNQHVFLLLAFQKSGLFQVKKLQSGSFTHSSWQSSRLVMPVMWKFLIPRTGSLV